MQVALYTVDVFTRRPFGGAQVAVLPDGQKTKHLKSR